jgi:hypothetical protein
MREAKPRRVGDRWQVRLTDEYGRRRKRLFDAHADAVKARTAEQARVAEVKDGLRDPAPADRRYQHPQASPPASAARLVQHPAQATHRLHHPGGLGLPGQGALGRLGAEQRFFEVEWAGSLLYLRGR